MENSPGESGSSYVLLFKPDVSMVPLAPFELPFNFYNGMIRKTLFINTVLLLV